MSLCDLPTELVSTICENADTHSLLAVAQTCSYLFNVSQRLIYCHISCPPPELVQRLAEQPLLAQFVRSFTIYKLFDSLQTAAALSNMTQLASLHVYLDPNHSWILPSHRPFLRLRHFACAFNLDSNVVEFLKQTPALTSLETDLTDSCSHIPQIPSTAIPCLTEFVGSHKVAKSIIPGRPVQNAQITAGDLHTDLDYLSQSTASLLILSATTSSPLVPFLQSLAVRLPTVKYLQVATTYRFPSVLPLEFYQETSEALKVTNLHNFELCGMHWFSEIKDDCRRVWQSTLPVANVQSHTRAIGF